MQVERELRVDVVTITHGTEGDRREAILHPRVHEYNDHGVELRLALSGHQDNELPPKGTIVTMKLEWESEDEDE